MARTEDVTWCSRPERPCLRWGDVRNGWSVIDQFTYLDEAVGW
jgi:hypothetical protein